MLSLFQTQLIEDRSPIENVPENYHETYHKPTETYHKSIINNFTGEMTKIE